MRFYFQHDSVPKSIIRGWMHALMLLCCPFWLSGFFVIAQPLNVHQYTWVWVIGSIVLMLVSSCFYHIPVHPTRQVCDIYRKLDMMAVLHAIFANIVPTLLYYDLSHHIWFYSLALGCTIFGIWRNQGRKAIIGGSLLALLVTICTIPELLYLIHQRFHTDPLLLLPPVTGTLVLLGIFVLYVWHDGDKSSDAPYSRPLVIATHDIIHFLSLILILNLGCYNSYILRDSVALLRGER